MYSDDLDSLQSIIISGSVLMSNDEPIEGAIITLRNLKDEVLEEKTTNRKGIFRIKDVKPKFYFLTIKHDFHGSKRIKINPRKNRKNHS